MKKTKSSQSSHPLVAFVILIVIAALITINILLYFKIQKKISIAQPIPVPPTKETEDMSDWQTYSNDQYNFSFKYPPALEVTNETSYHDYQDPVELFLRIQQYSYSPNGLYIRIQKVTPLTDALSTFREEFNYPPDTQSTRTIRRESDISGIQAKTYCNTLGLLPRCKTLLLKGDYLYIVGQLEDKDVTVYNQILSTFRFTDDMSDWQTYTNSQYGYSLKYPASKVSIVLDDPFEGGTKGHPSFRIEGGGHFAFGHYDTTDPSTEISIRGWIDASGVEYKPTKTVLGELEAYRDLGPDVCFIEYTLIPNETDLFTSRIEICDSKVETESKLLYDQILSTFKFIK